MNVFEGILELSCLSFHVSLRVSVCVQNTCFCQSIGRGINPLPDDKILDWPKLKKNFR